MRPAHIIACTALVTTMAGPSLAGEERYRLERTDDGYVRLDTETGRMSICQERGEQLVCRMATEDRAAYERDIATLEKRVDRLENRIDALDARPPAADPPSEEEFEQTLGYMERFFRRFMGIVGEMDRNFGKEERHEPPPDRT